MIIINIFIIILIIQFLINNYNHSIFFEVSSNSRHAKKTKYVFVLHKLRISKHVEHNFYWKKKVIETMLQHLQTAVKNLSSKAPSALKRNIKISFFKRCNKDYRQNFKFINRDIQNCIMSCTILKLIIRCIKLVVNDIKNN